MSAPTGVPVECVLALISSWRLDVNGGRAQNRCADELEKIVEIFAFDQLLLALTKDTSTAA